ncbi:MAG: ABC transporter substrate-binding protein [Mycobacteriales bacterium]
MLAGLLLAGCGTGGSTGSAGGGSGDKGSVTIAAFNFNESAILANMYAEVLKKAGYKVTVKSLTTREVVEPALEKGDVDVVPEYLSTLTEFLNGKKNGPNPTPLASSDVDKTVSALKSLLEPKGVKVLTPSPATDQNAFAVTAKFATDNNLTTLSDLASYKGKLVLGGPSECPKRPFCQLGLERTYGLKFTGFSSLDTGGPLTKTAIKNGKVQIGLVFSSDGGIEALGLKVLEDDKGLQNADNVVPVVRSGKAKADLTAALDKVSAALTTDELVALNKKADIDRQNPKQVAMDFLRSKGLI